MKLKHIFENAPQRPKMSKQDVLAALKDFNFRGLPKGQNLEQLITIDDQGLIHITNAMLTATGNTERVPLQLESVNSLIIYGLTTLAGLPRNILYFLDLKEFTGVDLTSATEVFIGSKNHGGELGLHSCPSLKTLEGIDNFKSHDQKIKIIIAGCENLAFDPFKYVGKYTFEFRYTIPPQMPLINAVTLTTPDQINFVLEDSKLEEIINYYRGKEADMPHLALELVRAGYRGHAGLT